MRRIAGRAAGSAVPAWRRPAAWRVPMAGLALLALAAGAHAQEGRRVTPPPPDSFYRLTTRTLEGDPAHLGAWAGQVALVVNVASRCGYTPQYEGLERLYRELKDRGFVVLGFPSNDFGGQEPGTAQEIRSFCSLNYGVTFPIFEKVVTRKGSDQSPVYAHLGRQAGQLPRWNFWKYLVGRDGRVRQLYASGVTPEDPRLRKDIEAALAE